MASYEATMLKLEKMAQANTATQMNWQEKMSKSSHQMEVADLVKAGLNPILSSGGNGAQSYTTSVDSAVNGIAGMASAREGANATKFAARQAAAATKAAAAANLAAARESAAANRYAADRHYDAQIKTNEAQVKIAEFNSKRTFWGNLRDIFESNGVQNSDFTKKFKYNAQDIQKNPENFVINKNKDLTFKNLNWRGRQFLQKSLRATGLSVTMPNQQLAYDALILQKANAIKTWKSIVDRHNIQTRNAANKWSKRVGSGIW